MTLAQLAEIPFADWGNLSALGCLIGLVIWAVTRGLPNVMERWSREAEAARSDFKEVTANAFAECEAQRRDFKEETAAQRVAAHQEALAQRASFERMLTEQREQSARLATAGHQAVNGLAAELRELRRASVE